MEGSAASEGHVAEAPTGIIRKPSTEEVQDAEWCMNWIRNAQDELDELQDALVEINFTRKAALTEFCQSTPHRLQFVRCRCLELLNGLAKVPDLREGDITSERASLAFELNACSSEAQLLLDHFKRVSKEESSMAISLRNLMGNLVSGPCAGPRRLCCGNPVGRPGVPGFPGAAVAQC
uniref:Uncharacterized protein n=2 Tax=Alexandrium monilatum TaxID=311494 RepID=A0A7S4PSC5_9DINO|mmetsp:Transcript_16835/g.50737  ORF Transcript_16835/g.50737 Transcript_16835/m.50737 type:complete len:178 (-) Transcript_16835:82-615(-)